MQVGADLGQQDLGRAQPDPGDGLQLCQFVGKGAQPRLDLGIDRSDGAVQLFDVGQLLGEEKPLVGPDLPMQRSG